MQSCIAFVIGTYIGEHEEKAKDISSLGIRRVFLLIILFLASVASVYAIEYLWKDSVAVRASFGSISTATFVILLINFLQRTRITNRFLSFLGKIYTEIYLSHQIVIDIFDSYCNQAFTNNVAIILISFVIIALVIVISIVIKCVEELWQRFMAIKEKQ